MADTKKVTLRAGNHTQEFTQAHAERLLAYPGTQWAELKAEKAEGKPLPPASQEEKTAPADGVKKTKST